MAALNEEQNIIRDQAKAWVSEQAPVTAFRTMRDSKLPLSFQAETWSTMIEMGWTGILVPEACGGSDLGYLTFGLILEETGRHLTASPLFSSAYAGVSALRLAGSDSQQQALLPKVVDGSAILTLAVDEGAHHAPAAIMASAVAGDGGLVLNGAKQFVMEGMAATHFVVAARSGDGITLLAVDAGAQGVSREALSTMDSRGYANLQFTDVFVPADRVLSEPGMAAGQLETILDATCAGLSIEMLGTASQAFDMTLEYLKTREQFGRVIGSFQALGHRAAELYTDMELARSCAEAALQAIDAESNEAPMLASLAKCRVGEFLYRMSNELIQMHGGIGMTDEFDAGFYLKRARVLEGLFGNRAYHRDRFAQLQNF